jgi:hypothetical protein
MKANKKTNSTISLFDSLEHFSKQMPSSFLSPTQKNDFLSVIIGDIGMARTNSKCRELNLRNNLAAYGYITLTI